MNFGLAQDWQCTEFKTEITIIYSVRHQWKTKRFHLFSLLKIFIAMCSTLLLSGPVNNIRPIREKGG